MADLLEKNLLALQSHQPIIVRLLLDTAPDPTYQLAQAEDGSLVVCRKQGIKTILLSHPQQAQAKAQAFADQKGEILASNEPLFFAGIRAGYEIREMHARLARKDWQTLRAVYVFEPLLDVLRLNLQAHDWSPMIESGQLYLFSGPNAAESCHRFFLEDLGKPQPSQIQVLVDVEQAKQIAALLGRIRSETAALAAKLKKDIDEYYDNLSSLDLARAYLNPASLRILLISNRLSYFIKYSIRDIKQALENLGATVKVTVEQTPIDKLTVPLMLQTLNDFRPHGLIFIDHLRGEYGDVFPRGLPFFTWLQDYMQNVFNEKAAKTITPRDLVVGYTKGLTALGYPPAQLFELPPLTNPDLFGAQTGEPAEHYRADLSFVSNISRPHQEAFAKLVEIYRKQDSRLVPVIEAVYRQALDLDDQGTMFADYQQFRLAVLAELESRKLQLEKVEAFLFQFYDDIIAPMIRHQSLAWAAESGRSLALYGRGWNIHPALAEHARGPVENGPDLADVYRGTAINLHINQFEIEHQRIIDGIMAGGFFLVRRMPSSGLLDLDECLFSTAEELCDKIDYFLAHPEKRREIVERNQAIIRQWATYDVGIELILQFFALQQVIKTTVEEEIESTADLADTIAHFVHAFHSDAPAFGLACLSAAISPKADALSSIAMLNRFQSLWGCPVWPLEISSKFTKTLADRIRSAAKKLDANTAPLLTTLTDAWLAGDSREALALRLWKQDLGSRPNCDDEHLWPLFCDHPSEEYRRQFVVEASHLPLSARKHKAAANLLLNKNALAGAWRETEKLNAATRSNQYDHLFALSLSYKCGYSRAGDELIERYRSSFQDSTLHCHLFALQNAMHKQICNRLPQSETILREMLSCDLPKAKFTQNVLAHTLLLQGDIPAGRAMLPTADKDDPKKFQTFNRHAHALADALLQGDPEAPELGSGRVELKQIIDIPENPDYSLRIDRLRMLGEHTLVLHIQTGISPFLFFDLHDQRWIQNRTLPPEFARAGMYPAFDTLAGKLYLTDIETPALMVFDEKLHQQEAIALPHFCRGYVEDLAIGFDGSIALADSYYSLLRLRPFGGDWLSLPLPDHNPEQSMRLTRFGAGFALFCNNRLIAYDNRGAKVCEKRSNLRMPELYGTRTSLFATGMMPMQLNAFKADLSADFTVAGVLTNHVLHNPSAVMVVGNELYLIDDRRARLYCFELVKP